MKVQKPTATHSNWSTVVRRTDPTRSGRQTTPPWTFCCFEEVLEEHHAVLLLRRFRGFHRASPPAYPCHPEPDPKQLRRVWPSTREASAPGTHRHSRCNSRPSSGHPTGTAVRVRCATRGQGVAAVRDAPLSAFARRRAAGTPGRTLFASTCAGVPVPMMPWRSMPYGPANVERSVVSHPCLSQHRSMRAVHPVSFGPACLVSRSLR